MSLSCSTIDSNVFSTDGDLCLLLQLLDLAEEFNSMLLIDEAHATGVFGANGAGCVEHFGCTGRALIQVGTLSKALGSLGGYVAGSKILIDFLRNRAASWIYTTALTPARYGSSSSSEIRGQRTRTPRSIMAKCNYFKKFTQR